MSCGQRNRIYAENFIRQGFASDSHNGRILRCFSLTWWVTYAELVHQLLTNSIFMIWVICAKALRINSRSLARSETSSSRWSTSAWSASTGSTAIEQLSVPWHQPQSLHQRSPAHYAVESHVCQPRGPWDSSTVQSPDPCYAWEMAQMAAMAIVNFMFVL